MFFLEENEKYIVCNYMQQSQYYTFMRLFCIYFIIFSFSMYQVKKLKRYEKEYALQKEQEKLQEDPVKLLQVSSVCFFERDESSLNHQFV